jgi:hypothetical protein
MNKQNKKNPLIPYENQWVALTSNKKKVLFASKNLKTLHKKIAKNTSNLILMKVPPFNMVFAP